MAQTQPEQDFAAAMHELQSNFDVRRLMFIVSNVLVPAMAMAMTDCMTGSDYPPELRWLPENVIGIVGVVLAVGGMCISIVLCRCHFGLVVNGTKMAKVESGTMERKPLNWLGVTTNFVALTALSGGAGSALLCSSFGLGWISWVAGGAFVVLLMSFLRINHWRANRLSAQLESSWQTGDISTALLEQHTRMSLDAATADISVVVTMAAALFAGVFNSLTNIGGIPAELDLDVPVAAIKSWGIPALSGFTLVSLLLTSRMVVRLRIALGDYSARLAKLRDEQDDPWRFRWLERSFLLFVLVQVLAGASGMILVWHLLSAVGGWLVGGAIAVAGIGWYVAMLAAARRKHA